MSDVVDSFSSYLELVTHLNSFSGNKGDFSEFVIEKKVVGLIPSSVAKALLTHTESFTHSVQGCITFQKEVNDYNKRSQAVARILNQWRNEDKFVCLRGWRSENYLVKHTFASAPLMEMERAATSLFGVLQYGCHLNAYVVNSAGELSMWIARRAYNKPTYPGMLDNMAAGGLSVGFSPSQCMRKECREEADVPEELLDNIKSVTCISYCFEDERGLFPECQFVFDLCVPDSFRPRNTDGEVHDFRLVSSSELKKLILSKEFKPNCAVIILDFLMRHGLLTPESEPHYTELLAHMHRSTEFSPSV